MNQLLCGFAAWGLGVGLTGPAQAQYMYTRLDVPGANYTEAIGINNTGQIVGRYDDADGTPHGFLRDVDGSFTTLDVPGARFTFAIGINDAGQIVGLYLDAFGVHGFLATAGG